MIGRTTYYVKPPRSFKMVLNQIKMNPELKEQYKFVRSILKYIKVTNHTYGELKNEDNYICVLHLLRMFVDAIFTCYGLVLANQKETYIRYFNEGNATNKLKCKSDNLTHGFIKKNLPERYEGLRDLYDESNKFIHPSVFFTISKKALNNLDEETKVEYKSFWFPKATGFLKNKEKFDFIFETLNNILYDVMVEVYNEAIVPNGGTTTINKQTKQNLALTKEAYEAHLIKLKKTKQQYKE